MFDITGTYLVQSKSDNTQTFNKSWQTMKYQIDASNCFWIGLERLHQITSMHSCRLDIHMNTGSSVLHAAYSSFAVGDESTSYKLSLTFDDGNTTDALGSQNGRGFSTYDNDNDIDANHNCASTFGAGWWFGTSSYSGTSCGKSDLNCYGPNYIWSAEPTFLHSDNIYMTCD